MKSLVSIVKADSGTAKEATKTAIDLIDGFHDLQGRINITIKPNLCRPVSSQAGFTTDPVTMEAIIEKIRSLSDCKIQIVETNNFIATADETFRLLGFLDLEKKYPNVKCLNITNGEKLRLNFDGKIFRTLQVNENLVFSDYMINVAKLKTHADYYYTGILKNAFGLILFRNRRPLYHGFMHEALFDLNTVYKPDLSIIDGAVGMEGFGPVGGNPKRSGVIISSKDPVAADTVAAEIAGFKPSRIKYLKYAAKRGLGEMKNIEVVGSTIEEVRTKYNFIPFRWYIVGKISLNLQRFSRRMVGLSRLLSLGRSAMSTIGYSELKNRLTIYDIYKMAKDVIIRVDD